MRARLIISAVLILLIAATAFWRLLDHDLTWRNSEAFSFNTTFGTMDGTLWLPNEATQIAVVFVHGDGPQDRTSGGGYAPLINAFLDRGIAVASWDKPGVGMSQGNWLDQSMADRANEVRAALIELDARFDVASIGAIGFSQAGWVLPKLSRDEVDFIALIGPAVSWQAQGIYYTRTRLALEGMGSDDIAKVIADQAIENEHAFGAQARLEQAPANLSPARWRFIQVNRTANATDELRQLNIPTLAIWGADDLNVDAASNAVAYTTAIIGRDPQSQVVIWPDATHGLLKSDSYNWQLVTDWSWGAKLRFLVAGRYAFAPGAIDHVTDWIEGIAD